MATDCIDIVAKGRVITIPLLVEQVFLVPEYKALRIEEVHDIVIRNDDVEPIDKFFALYPHDVANPEQPDTANVDLLAISPEAPAKYDWYFTAPPQWENQEASVLKLSVPRDPFQLEQTDEQKLTPRLLLGTVGWPKEIKESASLQSALWEARKSIIVIQLKDALAPRQTGVLRLRLRPTWQGLGIRSKVNCFRSPGALWPHEFSWDLHLDCARVVRHECKVSLEQWLRSKKGDVDAAGTAATLQQIAASGWGDRNTSVRIESQRLVIVAEGGISITERVRQATVQPMGATTAEYQEHGSQQVSAPAVVWLTGSSPNLDNDVVHTVTRIKDLIRYNSNPMRLGDITQKLAPGRQEAFGVLLRTMLECGLLEGDDADNQVVDWPFASDELPDFLQGLRKLRRIYDHPQQFYPEASNDELRLFQAFKNLHPFSISYVASWKFPRPCSVLLRVLWNVLIFLLSATAIGIAILALLK